MFYARVKGVSPEEETEFVDKALRDVELIDSKEVQIKELPLGMRRRLSIAISLVS